MTDRIFGYQLRRQGEGVWFVAARSYVHGNVHGGDRVTWGSEKLFQITAGQIEEMALEIAAAAIDADRRDQARERNKKGGDWLGAARSYLQCHINGGDRVIWGSEEILHVSARHIEAMAAEIAAAAINQDRREQARQALSAKKPQDKV